ncbi:MAG: hypothetical protein OXN89_25560 [Bryobacterales bacterium]|nr:hypothetical protein [Bryobacterales bacterium]
MFFVNLSVVAIALTLSPFTSYAEELRPSKLRPYELGPDGSLVVAGSSGQSVRTTARDPLGLYARTTRGSAVEASIGGNSELARPREEMALRSLAIESPNNFLILSGVSEEKVDEMVTAAKALAQDDSSKQQLQSLIKEKRREAEKAKDWKRMALFLHLNQMLDSEDLR